MRKKYLFGIFVALCLVFYLRFVIVDLFELLAGPGWSEESDSFLPWWMVNWIVLYLPAWFLGLWDCESSLNRAHMCIHRFRNIRTWWFRVFGRMIAYVAVIYLMMSILLFFVRKDIPAIQMLLCMILIAIHALFSLAFAIWIRLLSGSMILAAIFTLVLEAIAKVFVVTGILQPAYSIFSWGMYHYSSNVYGKGGFVIGAAVIIQFIIIISPCFCVFGKGKEILLRRINDGKVH